MDKRNENEEFNIEEVELPEYLDNLLDNVYEDLMETECEHCTYNLLKMAIMIAHQLGVDDGKEECMQMIHCSMTDCEDCELCEG